MVGRSRAVRNWRLDVGGWRFGVVFLLFVLIPVFAQTPPQLPPGGLIQLQVPQPRVDVSSPVTATAVFDPPVVRAGEKTFYRVNVDASLASIEWPGEISATPELKFGAGVHGQIVQQLNGGFRPLTAFVYEVQSSVAGQFTVTNFSVNIAGQPLEIPAARLEVVADNSTLPPTRRLVLETSAKNLFLGQPFKLRVLLPNRSGNEIEALREIQINGDGLMIDKTAMRQSIEVVNRDGQSRPSFVCEMIVTPIATGPQNFSVQAFTAGREFSGPISITGQIVIPGGPAKYVLLVSDAIEIRVRPLPAEGELPGFTGAIGKFSSDPPQLSTNRLRVGEPVHLKISFHGEGDLTRFVPPAAPGSRDWQIIADKPPAIGFTLIPQADEATNTPAIPFSCFDPASGKYMDLTIPPLPVTVVGEGLPVQLAALDAEAKSAVPLKLSWLAMSPRQTAASLKPPQLRGWFLLAQLLPVFGIFALWQWDCRRRFLEAHPEIVRRHQAKRALRHEKNKLQKAVNAGDATAFVQHAAGALRIVVAPNYPANPHALVGGDVLEQLDEAERNGRAGETVRKIFAAADAQFASAPPTQADLMALHSDVEMVLQSLEEKL